MDTLRYFANCILLTLGRLRRQLIVLVGLALLCLLLSQGAGRAAGELLSRGVGFSGVTLAVTAPEGDGSAELLARYMGGAEDVAQYCQIAAMEEHEAIEALKDGAVTAVLVLPERFIQRVMWGENPDLRLIVAGDRPLESLLLLWVGQGAVDILSAVQSGVYAVLDLFAENPPPDLERDQVVLEINLRYIAMTLDRAAFFRQREVSAAETLPVPLHYALSLAAYFALSAAPLFMPLYTGGWLAFQRRLRSAGRGCAPAFFSAVTVGAAALFVLLAPSLLLAGDGRPLAMLCAAAGMSLYCSLFAALCCLACAGASGCGGVSFTASLLFLFLAGGVVPPVLLPQALRRLSPLSPVTWLRQLAARSMGFDMPPLSLACLLLTGLGMAAVSCLLYRRRAEQKEGES